MTIDPAATDETTGAVTRATEGDDRLRCPWATGEWLTPYHDEEWGVAVHSDRQHFEHLVLEGAQAGLSWITILKRRDAYRRAFAGFDPETVAGYGAAEVEALMADPGIIRNRRKIESTVGNAAAFRAVQQEHGSFEAYLLNYTGGAPVVNAWRSMAEVPAATPGSEALSKDLRRRGFRFVGPVICYSHLQAVGLVMDHLTSCYRYPQLAAGR